MITEIQRVGDMVLQQVAKPDGTVLRYQYGKPGDAASIIHVQSLEEGRKALLPVAITIADRNGNAVVRRIVKNGNVSYDWSIDGVEFVPAISFAAARHSIGKDK
jgi:hypothetical protein